MISPEQQKIQDRIIHANVGFGGFSEIHGISVMSQLEVEGILAQDLNSNADVEIGGTVYESLRQYRIYILSLDGYGYRGDLFKIQSYREGFSDMSVEELLDIFSDSGREKWENNREYFYALFGIIEDKLQEKGIDLGFDELFEPGI